MKKILIFLVFFTGISLAQFNDFFYKDKNILGGGLGLNWIDNKPHYSLRLFPEFSFAKFGVGLDLRLDFTPDGNLRKENFNEFSDYLSIIRYVRYGNKNDDFYARLGALDYSTLGHGSIIYLYNNSTSFDTRKVGVELKVDLEKFGGEFLYSSFGESGVVGLRGFYRPLLENSLPILNKLEIGASFVTDLNKYSGVLNGVYNFAEDKFSPTADEGSTTIMGLDIGLPLVKSDFVTLQFYLDYAKIVDFGSGAAAGIMADFNLSSLVNVRTKLERRWNGKNYLPGYFNQFYEIERFELDKKSGVVNSKVQLLKNLNTAENGFYGEMLIRILGTFDIVGSFQKLDKVSNSGILHLYTDILPENSTLVARAGYDKINIENTKDLFTLNDRSYFYTELGYKPMPYLIASVVYHWNFAPVRDADDNVIDFIPQKRIEPKLSFIYQF